MSDPWDDDQVSAEPWDQDLTINEAKPAATKSERTLRDLSVLGGRFDPVAAGETALAVGSGLLNEAVRGAAGIAGTFAGMVPGGDSPNELGNKALEAIPDFTYEPRTTGGQAGVDAVGKAMQAGVTEVKKLGSPVAYAGARAAGASPEEASLSMQDFLDTENALGEGTFDVTRSPTFAVVAQILPEIASMGVPVKKPKVRQPMRDVAPDMPPSGFGGIGDVEAPRQAPRQAPQRTEMGAFENLRDALKRGDKEAVLAEVNANPAIVAAFEQLGIEFTPGMVSDNAALRQVEAGLASKADSGLSSAYELTDFKLNESARNLIDEAGGDSTSAASVAQDIETRFNEVHGGLRQRESDVWSELETRVPREADVNARVAASKVYREAELAGGGDIDRGLRSLRQHERRLFEMTHERVRVPDPNNPEAFIDQWQYRDPTYAAVNRFREDVGNSIQTGKPFGDANSGALDQMYGDVASIQGRVARAEGYGDDWARANELTQTRKELEASMQRTLGRGLNQSVVTRVNGAMNALLKGDVKKWDQLFTDLPAETRAAAAAQALENVFFTAGKNTKMSQAWTNNFDKIRRDSQLRDRIFDQLPMGSRSQFMAIGEAATGFYRATEKLNRSNTANAMQVIDAIEQPGFMNRILGGAAEKAGGRLPVVGDWIRQVTGRTADAKKAGAAEKIKAGTDLLEDPAMHRAIVEYAAGRVDRANEILRASQSWAAWAKTQPIPMQERLQTAGIVALFDEETEE